MKPSDAQWRALAALQRQHEMAPDNPWATAARVALLLGHASSGSVARTLNALTDHGLVQRSARGILLAYSLNAEGRRLLNLRRAQDARHARCDDCGGTTVRKLDQTLVIEHAEACAQAQR